MNDTIPSSSPNTVSKDTILQAQPPAVPKQLLSAQILAWVGALVCIAICIVFTWPTMTQDSMVSIDSSQLTYEALLLSEGISSQQIHDQYVPPLIPYLLHFGYWTSNTLGYHPQAWFHHSALVAILLTLFACLWGVQLLYRRRDIAWIAGLLFTLFAIPLVWQAQVATWYLPINAYVMIAFIYVWRLPHSAKSFAVLGLCLSQALIAHSIYLLLILYALVLSLWKIPHYFLTKDTSIYSIDDSILRKVQIKKRSMNFIALLLGLIVGLTPWLLKGNLSESPLDISKQILSHQWIFDITWQTMWSAYQSVWAHLLLLVMMLAMTWMSMHISGTNWSRRGFGLVILFLFHVVMGVHFQAISSHGMYVILVSLIMLISHPWSAQGTFLLLPFEPKVRRGSHLLLFTLFLLYPAIQPLQALQKYWHSQYSSSTEVYSTLSQERLQVGRWMTQQKNTTMPVKSLWGWGPNTWPLYTQSRLHSSAKIPFLREINFEDPKWKSIPQQLTQEQTDMIVIEHSMPLKQFMELQQLLQHQYRMINPSDYAWNQKSLLTVYVHKRFPRTLLKPLPLLPSPSTNTPPPPPIPKRIKNNQPYSNKVPKRPSLTPPSMKANAPLPPNLLPSPTSTSNPKATPSLNPSDTLKPSDKKENTPTTIPIPAPSAKAKNEASIKTSPVPEIPEHLRPKNKTKEGKDKSSKNSSKDPDGKKADGKKSDGKKADGKKADEKKSDEKKADEKKADVKKKSTQKTNTKKK